VTLIERDKIGGTCLNRGCIPTKALLHDAKMLRLMRSSAVFQSLLHGNLIPRINDGTEEEGVQDLVKGVEMLSNPIGSL